MSTATATSMKLTAEQESENARINAENERLRKQARAKRTISLTLSYVALALVTFLMIFPLIIVVIVSFTPNAVTQTWPPKIIPSAWTLDNYTSLFQRLPIGRELLNTIVFAGAVTIISVFFDSLAAYGLSRVDFKGRGILLAVLIATMMIPAMALLIPVYKLLGSMGLVNSYLGIIIPRMADVGGIFLLRQFFISIPKDLDNAARIDGAGEFRIFAQIILPNAVPAILTVGMFNFMGNWNDLLWPLIMTSKPETHHHRRSGHADRSRFVRHAVRRGDGRRADLRPAVAHRVLLRAEALRRRHRDDRHEVNGARGPGGLACAWLGRLDWLDWLDWLRPAESVRLLSAPVRAIVRFTYYTYPPSFHHRLRRRLYRAPGQAVTVAPPAVAAFCGYVKYVVEVW